ncbi:hypothetical protein COU18_03845 [Candidatus Kaiserbacteria bacterium CG10_big_fil_rev_8_21_14_0_10_51_14]|uniref:Helix-turn-helix domain-containing protein n=1 Tax=Candidatus Kaiserbacteria bacterium CG10_big_fil_rev_8_21_14_0_10_51_14 TaxID=1974610 RepID=A0A2H0UAS3_9BACT|nr:MAG: hypothetical protein COU18_03845 [Candidatus Kaiserbacteria bacterium CG10_big_fil_rev_8_21_14_0_10_51_14]
MADEIVIEGVEYVSSKRASELSGYAQDYIGQLARRSYIDARRVGGLWHVSMVSLQEYEEAAAISKSRPSVREQPSGSDSLISFDGKDYISATRAAELTGYHQDYVGQLARAGTILSRQVGNRWYVDREALLAHKAEKDRLLAAVQAQSVGLRTSASGFGNTSEVRNPPTDEYLTYTKDTGDLIPPLRTENEPLGESFEEGEFRADERQYIPIRVNRVIPRDTILKGTYREEMLPKKSTLSRKALLYGTLGAIALTLAGGATFWIQRGVTSSTAPIKVIGDFVESLVVPEIIYERRDDF